MNAYRRWFQPLLSAGFAALLALAAASSQADETITYIHWDAQGSPVAATDEAGNVVWRESYRPYGERLNNQTAAGPHTRWYTGHPQDPDTGLVYTGARYYDPVIGRFLSIDPVEFQEDNLHTFNRYAYGNNNPYRYVDPDGKLPILIPIGIGVGLELLNLGLEIHDIGSNPCSDCVRSSGAGIPGGLGGTASRVTRNILHGGSQVVPKGADKLNAKLIQENPRNLIPTQTKSEMLGSQVKRLTKDMKQNGFDQSKPVDAWRNPNTGRLEIQDGHHRTEAARKAGLDKIPVLVWE